VSFLELFYDLVYVVIISQIAHAFSAHLDGRGLLVYCSMFAIVWWAWINGTMYHDLHGNDDLRTRVFTFVQMLTVAAMAVFAHHAVGESSRSFALSYAAFLLVLAFLWWRTGVHDRDHRLLSIPYSSGVLLSAAVFAVSAIVREEIRYILWAGALVLALFGTQLAMYVVARLNPAARAQRELAARAGMSAVERFGLFTIIVLGEVIVGVVRGLAAHHHLDWAVGGIAALGMALAIGLWWNYFDFVSLELPRPGGNASTVWMYLHLPLTMAIAAVGAATLNAVQRSPAVLGRSTQLTLAGAVAVALITIALLMHTVGGSKARTRVRSAAKWVAVAAAAGAGGLGFLPISTLALMGLLVAILAAPVVAGFAVWVRGGAPSPDGPGPSADS
jgi:low temperature requirement protein LtrA